MPVINTTSKNLKKYQQKTIQKIKDLVVDKITEAEEAAVRDAPLFVTVNKRFSPDELEGEMYTPNIDDKNSPTFNRSEHHMYAYIEFGTGLYAADLLEDYPQWVVDIASDFYVDGSGRLKSSPYFFNNFLEKEAEFKNELNKILDGSVDDN